MEQGEGIFFPRNREIHMWWMSVPIDVVFLRKENGANGSRYFVSSVHENVKPWKLLPIRDGKASETLELTAGTISRCAVSVGDELCIS